MEILELRVLKGPNYWSTAKKKLIQLLLDPEELRFKLTNEIPGFYEHFKKMSFSFDGNEGCDDVTRNLGLQLKEGISLCHVVGFIALELQRISGMNVDFGITSPAGKDGNYYIIFSYEEEAPGVYAAQAAVRITEALICGAGYDIRKEVEQIKKLWVTEKLGPSTASIVEEAQRRNIPFIRLDKGSLVQLGYGAKQKRIEATITSQTNSIAVDIAGNKEQTKNILTKAGIPVPEGYVVEDVHKLKEVIERIGFPIVIKPLDGNHGKGATINIRHWQDAIKALDHAKVFSKQAIVERFIEGRDFRVLVINNRFVAAALRTPACIVGDGIHTVQELINIVNRDPRRGDQHDNVLTRIIIDDEMRELLAMHHCTLDTILPLHKEVYLKRTANLSTGGTATDVTDEVHPYNVFLFERISRLIGLDICGIDVMATDLTTPLQESGGAIIEVNAAPGFRMHLSPSSGQCRNVAAPVVDMLFNGNGRIPIVAVTGTNGKTTTTRLVAHMAQQAGLVTGYTTTDGIYLDQNLLMQGDCSGPYSAQVILCDPSVEFAVLETARGGMLRSGLAFDQCDTAIITNVAEDHLGLDGIDTLDKLASVKSILAESVSETGYAILNADDDLVYAMKDRLKCKVALFSIYSDSVRIEEHCGKGEIAAVYENGFLLLRIGDNIIPIDEVKNVPITFSGKAEFNISNALAACLAAYTSKIKLSTIRQALRTFIPSSEKTPGRINIFEFDEFTFILDYAHNQHGVRALGKFIKSWDAPVKTGIITGVGDRRDEDLIALGEEAARIFDEIIIRHDDDMRGRSVEEVEQLISKGIFSVDPNKKIICSLGECESVSYAIENARPQSLIVALIDNIQKVTEVIKQHQKERVSQLQKAG